MGQSHCAADRNLLFGILALQMDFISRDALLGAMNAWVLDKSKTLGQILCEQKALTPDDHAWLEAGVARHLSRHGDDAEKSLAALSPVVSVKEELKKIADHDVDASLVHVSADRADVDDPRDTISYAVGTPTSAGSRFRILRPHAKGGLGQVYVAHDTELHREVALKEIQDRHADDRNSRARFVLEAEITGGLEHPGIVPVYGLGQYADGRPFYAMRFIRGDSLHDAIKRFHTAKGESATSATGGLASATGELELRKLLGRFIDVCEAIQYAHDRGVLHRDLKPGNIMLGKYGETLVVDWGLAKPVGRTESVEQPGSTDEPLLKPTSASGNAETLPGSALGTPSYMSPEQAVGRLDQLGPASDVYSLGATLYCLLTGKPPVEDKDVAVMLRKVQHGEIPRPRQLEPDADPALEAICLKAMALKPADRYPSPRLLADDLECWLADKPVSAWPEPWTVKTRRWVGRHRQFVTGVAAALLVGVVSLLIATVLLTDANDQLSAESDKVQKASGELQKANTNLEKANTNLEQTNKDLAELAEKERNAKEGEEKARDKAEETLAVTATLLAQSRWKEGRVAMANDLLEMVPVKFRFRGWRFLKRQFEGSYCTLYGHVSPLSCVVFSPNGQRLASASDDGTVKVWDARTTQNLLTLQVCMSSLEMTAPDNPTVHHKPCATRVAFSPDGQRLASASADGIVKIWDAHSGKQLVSFKAHSDPVTSVAFGPDGQWLASACDTTVKVWDARSGKELLVLKGHADWATISLAFSAAGQCLAAASGDGTVKVWDTSSGKELHTRVGGVMTTASFSPDGQRLAAWSEGTVSVCDAHSGKVIFSIKEPASSTIAFSPDGQRLAWSSLDGTVKIWDARSGQDLQTFKGHFGGVRSVAFSADGQRLASASEDMTVKLWNICGDEEVLRMEGDFIDVINNTTMALSNDGHRLASANPYGTEVKVWDVRSGQKVLTLKGQKGLYSTLVFSPNGQQLVLSSDDIWRPDGQVTLPGEGNVKVWDAHSGKELLVLKAKGGIFRRLAFSPGGERLGSASDDGTVKVWDVRSGKEMLALKGKASMHSRVAFSPDGKRLVLSSEGTVEVWDTQSGQEFAKDTGRNLEAFGGNQVAIGYDAKLKAVVGHSGAGANMVYSSDGQLMASGDGKQVTIWDALSGQELRALPGGSHLVFSPDGHRFVSANEGTVQIWRIPTCQDLLILKGHKGHTGEVVFSADGQRLVSKSSDGSVKLWDTRTGQDLLTFHFTPFLPGIIFPMPYAVFSGDGKRLAWGRDDGAVTLWDNDTGKAILTLDGKAPIAPWPGIPGMGMPGMSIMDMPGMPGMLPGWFVVSGVKHRRITSIAFSADGHRLAAGRDDGTMKMWDSSSGQHLLTIKAHSKAVTSIAFSSDGRRLVSCSIGTVKFWDARTGQDLLTYKAKSDVDSRVGVSRDGQRVIMRDGVEVFTCDVENCKVIPNSTDPWPFDPSGVAIDPSGKQLAYGMSNRIQLIDLGSPSKNELAFREDMARTKPWWHKEQGRHHEKEKNWYAAAFHWSWAVSGNPTETENWKGLNAACEQLGSWQHAQDACTRLLKDQPSLALVYYQRSSYDFRQRDWQDSALHLLLAKYLTAMAKDKSLKTASVAAALGEAHALGGEWEQAALYFNMVGDWEPKTPQERRRQAWVQLGADNANAYRRLCHDWLSDFEAIEKQHDMARNAATLTLASVAGSPDPFQQLILSPELDNQLGRLQTYRNNLGTWGMELTYDGSLAKDCGVAPKRLAKVAHLLAAMYPQQWQSLENVGAAYYRNDDFATAEKYLTEAVRLHGEGGTQWMNYFLAMTHQRLGNPDQAKKFFDRAHLSPKYTGWEEQVIDRLLRREAAQELGLKLPTAK